MNTDILLPSEEYGFVYVLKNARMPGLIKIGMTEREDYQQRINELNKQTGVPVAFDVAYACKVRREDARRIEGALHRAFVTDRINPSREFFEMDEDRVIAILSLFQLENITDEATTETDAALEPAERFVRDKERVEAPKRRPTLNLYALGCNKDDTLYWKDDASIIATVASERSVIYNGAEMSLTRATSQIKGLTYGIQPTPFWVFGEKTLKDIYDEKYSPVDSVE